MNYKTIDKPRAAPPFGSFSAAAFETYADGLPKKPDPAPIAEAAKGPTKPIDDKGATQHPRD